MIERFLIAACLVGAAPFESDRLHCRAEQAIRCGADGCEDQPDENPNAELSLEKGSRTGELCMVTSCRSVRWFAADDWLEISDGAESYSLQLTAPGKFRFLRADGSGWRGSCSAGSS